MAPLYLFFLNLSYLLRWIVWGCSNALTHTNAQPSATMHTDEFNSIVNALDLLFRLKSLKTHAIWFNWAIAFLELVVCACCCCFLFSISRLLFMRTHNSWTKIDALLLRHSPFTGIYDKRSNSIQYGDECMFGVRICSIDFQNFIGKNGEYTLQWL